MAEAESTQDLKGLVNIFRYVSKEFPKSFFKMIHQLRLDNAFCDIQLLVEDREYSAHKIVLMAGSPYFHAMFHNDMSEHNKGIVNIGGVSADIFSLLLQFLYTGEIEVTEATCEALLMAADMFSITDVVTACCTFLQERLQPHNCIGIYTFAETICCEPLKVSSELYIHKNFLKMVKEEEFYGLAKETLLHFLNSESLHVENEFQVFKAAINWILCNPTDRKKHIFDVMSTIRLPIISESKLDRFMSELTDKHLSIKIALQSIIGDFNSDKKMYSVLEKKMESLKLKQYMTVPRRCARKNIYICGGFTRPVGGRWSDARTLNTMERYDTFHQTWHECWGFEYHRSALGVGTVNGQVCVVGGENDRMLLDTVEAYDPVSCEWSCLPGITAPRCGLGVCSMDNCLYLVGGWIGSEIGSQVEKYDPDRQKWEVITHCRTLKCWVGVTADKGLLYIAGGCNDLSDELSSVESLNPVTKEWVTLPDLNVRRSYAGLVVLDDCLYAVGGWNESNGALSSVEKLSFDKGYWVEMSPMCMARAGACLVVVNNMLYVMGGRTHTDEFTAPSTLRSMEAYNPQTDTWTAMGDMITSRCEGGAVVI